LGARFKIEVSVEEKVMGVEMLVPEAVCTDAVNPKLVPSSMEVLAEGLRLILPGKIGGPDFLLPPHPPMLHREETTATDNHRPRDQNLPMHPLRRSADPAKTSWDKPLNELENL
jgi:hypothetical protein